MQITWYIDDGYVGGSRPQYLVIPDQEIEECETANDVAWLLQNYVDDEIRMNVVGHPDGYCPDEAVALMEKARG